MLTHKLLLEDWRDVKCCVPNVVRQTVKQLTGVRELGWLFVLLRGQIGVTFSNKMRNIWSDKFLETRSLTSLNDSTLPKIVQTGVLLPFRSKQPPSDMDSCSCWGSVRQSVLRARGWRSAIKCEICGVTSFWRHVPSHLWTIQHYQK